MNEAISSVAAESSCVVEEIFTLDKTFRAPEIVIPEVGN